MENTEIQSLELHSAGLLKRLAAMVYDILLITASWMVVGGIIVFLNGNRIINAPILPILLPLVIAAFYTHFWMKDGQTLGMQTWRIKLVPVADAPLSKKQCLVRLAAAVFSMGCFGLGYLWLLVDRDKMTWHDRLSATKVVVIPKN